MHSRGCKRIHTHTQNPHTRTLTQIFYLHAWTSKFHTWVTINTYTPLIIFVDIYTHTNTLAYTFAHTDVCWRSHARTHTRKDKQMAFIMNCLRFSGQSSGYPPELLSALCPLF